MVDRHFGEDGWPLGSRGIDENASRSRQPSGNWRKGTTGRFLRIRSVKCQLAGVGRCCRPRLEEVAPREASGSATRGDGGRTGDKELVLPDLTPRTHHAATERSHVKVRCADMASIARLMRCASGDRESVPASARGMRGEACA